MNRYRYILALGSNLGDGNQNCAQAFQMLSSKEIEVLQTSRIIKTQALPNEALGQSQPDFTNCVAEIATDYTPTELYSIIRQIEDLLGHDRSKRWADRHMDIDILLWAMNNHTDWKDCQRLILEPRKPGCLQIPHYDFFNRSFLCELVSDDLGLSLSCYAEFFGLKKSKTSLNTQ